MFTGNTMALSAANVHGSLDVRRDCKISYVGKVPTRLPQRLVAASQPAHLTGALAQDGIAGIVTTDELADGVPEALGLAVHADPVAAVYEVQGHIASLPGFQWADFETEIDPTTVIEEGAFVAPRNVRIGADTVVATGSIVRERSIIGANCLIGPGTVVGCEAFEVDHGRRPLRLLRQSGGVRLGDDVEICAKGTLVRSTFGGFTELGAGTKLDAQVHVAHDCVIGENVEIAACAELSGRVTVGDRAFIGPNSSISNGLEIGPDAAITIGAVVTRNVGAGEKVSGNFAIPHMKFMRFLKSIG